MCTSNDDIVTRNPCPNIAQHTPSYRAEENLPYRGATGPWAEADAILIDFVVRASASRPKAAKVMELALLAAAACPFLARAAAAAPPRFPVFPDGPEGGRTTDHSARHGTKIPPKSDNFRTGGVKFFRQPCPNFRIMLAQIRRAAGDACRRAFKPEW